MALNPSHAATTTTPSSLMTRLVTRFMRLHHLSIETSTSTSPSGRAETNFSLVPGHGRHLLQYNNTLISVHRERIGKSFDTHGQPFETIKLTTLYRDRHIFTDIFQEAHALSAARIEGKTVIYTLQNMTWTPLGEPKRKRPLESVVLAPGTSAGILSDMTSFLAAREWYLDRGIPYRRGYLLHGPPGTGKTSFVQALAGHLDFSIAMLSLSQTGLHDDLLNRLLLNLPPKTIVLLEDADAAFVNRRARDGDGYSGASVTFSGLLNALDGVASAEERIVFMTTNHVERLDAALIRPGRVDVSVRLGEADEVQIGDMWDRFYGGETGSETEVSDGDGDKAKFLSRARDCGLVGRVSTAELQGLFLVNKDDPKGAIETVGDFAAEKMRRERERSTAEDTSV